MIYLDISVLLVYTLTQSIEVERSRSVRKLFAKINSRLISAATSFYALHEVHVFAIENAPDLELGYEYGKSALLEILKADNPSALRHPHGKETSGRKICFFARCQRLAARD